MPKYRIYAGLGGGFGGAEYIKTTDDVEKSDAESEAYEEACNIYYSYEGLHGLFNREDELEEDPDLTDDDLDSMESDDKESWIEYWVEEDDESETFDEE